MYDFFKGDIFLKRYKNLHEKESVAPKDSFTYICILCYISITMGMKIYYKCCFKFFLLQSSKHVNITEIITLCNNTEISQIKNADSCYISTPGVSARLRILQFESAKIVIFEHFAKIGF